MARYFFAKVVIPFPNEESVIGKSMSKPEIASIPLAKHTSIDV
jgi:hypothetical protein